MSPSSAWMAGRMAAMTFSTCSSTSTPFGGGPPSFPTTSGQFWHLWRATPTRATAFHAPTLRGVYSLVLAHQGGWDEILLVGGPVMVFAWLLAVARRRAVAIAEAGDGAEPTVADDT